MTTRWRQAFEDPIELPGGKRLVTLQDAAGHIQKLKSAEQRQAHWQLAVETLINAAEGRDFVMHARIAMMRALNHGKPPPDPQVRRKAVKKFNIIR